MTDNYDLKLWLMMVSLIVSSLKRITSVTHTIWCGWQSILKPRVV